MTGNPEHRLQVFVTMLEDHASFWNGLRRPRRWSWIDRRFEFASAHVGRGVLLDPAAAIRAAMHCMRGQGTLYFSSRIEYFDPQVDIVEEYRRCNKFSIRMSRSAPHSKTNQAPSTLLVSFPLQHHIIHLTRLMCWWVLLKRKLNWQETVPYGKPPTPNVVPRVRIRFEYHGWAVMIMLSIVQSIIESLRRTEKDLQKELRRQSQSVCMCTDGSKLSKSWCWVLVSRVVARSRQHCSCTYITTGCITHYTHVNSM